jgi:hypothetical protein
MTDADGFFEDLRRSSKIFLENEKCRRFFEDVRRSPKIAIENERCRPLFGDL